MPPVNLQCVATCIRSEISEWLKHLTPGQYHLAVSCQNALSAVSDETAALFRCDPQSDRIHYELGSTDLADLTLAPGVPCPTLTRPEGIDPEQFNDQTPGVRGLLLICLLIRPPRVEPESALKPGSAFASLLHSHGPLCRIHPIPEGTPDSYP